MIAPDRDRRFQIAALHEVVDSFAHLGALAVTEPADARRQSLQVNAFARETQPAIQRAIVRKQLECEVVSLANVFGVARQRDPAKRPFAFAEQRSNVFGHESRNLERVFATGVESLLANVVAVIKRDGAAALQR